MSQYKRSQITKECVFKWPLPLTFATLQAESMEATVGHPLKPLAELPPQEVRVAEEKHTLSVSEATEDLRIVLTRPLVAACSKAVLEVITSLLAQPEGWHADIDT